MAHPDPNDPGSFTHRFAQAGKHRYHLIDQLPPHWVGPVTDAPTLLLCHGFPDLWYGWRYQIHEFAARGWRVLCPSQLGYDGTDKPIPVENYSYKSIAYDMNLLLDAVGVKGKVVVVGHDWGGMVAWRFVNYFPHRVIAIACVCTPYQAPTSPKAKYMKGDELIRKYLPNFGYQIYFQTPEAEVEMDEVIDQFLVMMFSPSVRKQAEGKPRAGNWVLEGRLRASIHKQIKARRAGQLPLPPREKELDYYVDTYTKNGMRGPLSWYKTRDVNFREEQAADLPPFPTHIPALQIAAGQDAALPPSMGLSPSVLNCFPAGNLEVKVMNEADHWVLQDETVRDEVTDILASWIENVLAGKWRPSQVTPKL